MAKATNCSGTSWWNAALDDASRLTGLSGWVAALIDGVLAWQERARSRHALQALDDRMLRDMGISRADVQRECDKPFWRP